MRTISIEKTLLTFNELNKEQKEKVLENNRDINIDDDFWHECSFEFFTSILENLGFENVKIYYSGFCSQGDGLSFTGNFIIPKNKKEIDKRLNDLKGHCNDNYLSICNDILSVSFLSDLKDDIETILVYQQGYYYHENTMYLENSDNIKFLNLIKQLAKMFYQDLENEYYHLISDDAVAETLTCNEYEFDTQTLKIY